MRVYGIDFTSRPHKAKPITCAVCQLDNDKLRFDELRRFANFEGFEQLLVSRGPWIAGIDFPFGQSRRFIENIGWPSNWADYASNLGSMSREAFRRTLDDYRAPRPAGDKEHRREVDIRAGSISPQKLYGVPVGLMFFEGAPRLLKSGATIKPVHEGDPKRIVVEAYPGVLARQLIERRSYKHDTKKKQTNAQLLARREILSKLGRSWGVVAPAEFVDDPSGDELDALLCAVQAAWAWSKRDANFGIPETANPIEGWIVDQSLFEPAA